MPQDGLWTPVSLSSSGTPVDHLFCPSYTSRSPYRTGSEEMTEKTERGPIPMSNPRF